jgi:LysM repeat protein
LFEEEIAYPKGGMKMNEDIDHAPEKPDQHHPTRVRKTWVGKETIFIFIAVCIFAFFSFGLFLIYMDKSNYSGKMAFIEQRMTALEQKISSLEKQQTNLYNELVKTFAEKVEIMEKHTSEKEKTPEPPKLLSSPDKKRYHEVQKGETLFRIARKYGISVDDLRRINNLTAGDTVVRGQKLLIDTGEKR